MDEINARYLWQDEVHDEEVNQILLKQGKSAWGVGRLEHFKTGLLQDCAEELAEILFVVNDQNTWHVASTLSRSYVRVRTPILTFLAGGTITFFAKCTELNGENCGL